MADKEYCRSPGCGLRIEPNPSQTTGWGHLDTIAGRDADSDHFAAGEHAAPIAEPASPEELAEDAHPIAEYPPELERAEPDPTPKGKPIPLGGWETVEAFD